MRRYGWLALIIGFLLVVASLWALWDQQSVSGLQTEATRAVEPLVPTVPIGTTTTYVPPPTELPPTAKPEHELAPGLYSLRQRVGVGVALVPPDLDLVLATLGVGWYLDWHTQLAPRAAGQLEYAQMVRVPAGVLRPGVEEIGRVATANPGALWLIGRKGRFAGPRHRVGCARRRKGRGCLCWRGDRCRCARRAARRHRLAGGVLRL